MIPAIGCELCCFYLNQQSILINIDNTSILEIDKQFLKTFYFMHQIGSMNSERATAVLVDFCHTKLRFQEKKIFWALPWENLRLLMRQKFQFNHTSVRIVRCRIARTRLIPLYLKLNFELAVEVPQHIQRFHSIFV